MGDTLGNWAVNIVTELVWYLINTNNEQTISQLLWLGFLLKGTKFLSSCPLTPFLDLHKAPSFLSEFQKKLYGQKLHWQLIILNRLIQHAEGGGGIYKKKKVCDFFILIYYLKLITIMHLGRDSELGECKPYFFGLLLV